MNAPQFDVTHIPLHPSDPNWMAAVVKEERRACEAIDERLDAVNNEFCALSDKAREIATELNATRGFFARIGIHMRLRSVASRMTDLINIRHQLIIARWRRTYGA